ncbi:hypothetical protein [Alteromonas gracilis]|uniref:hypothetical protein n=1 Tax=Alteromonas gracilis TaxID=1479524 RepID=UPI00321BBABF
MQQALAVTARRKKTIPQLILRMWKWLKYMVQSPFFIGKKHWRTREPRLLIILTKALITTTSNLHVAKLAFLIQISKKENAELDTTSELEEKKLIDGAFFGGTIVSAQQSADLGSTELGKKHEEHVEIVQQLYVEDEQFRQMYDKLQQIEKGYQEAHNKTFGSLSQYDKKSEESSN